MTSSSSKTTEPRTRKIFVLSFRTAIDLPSLSFRPDALRNYPIGIRRGWFYSMREAIYVLVINIASGLGAGGNEPLRAIRRDPDGVAGRHGVPVVVESIHAAAGKKNHSVLHHVRLNKRKRRAGIVRENIHGHVGRQTVGNERFEAQMFVAEEGCLLN